ncbi:hypothetical protein EJ04DRAFT_515031 [Polyplosphaeria fusca]|uniref:N-acetyltransferase domain-containing protein n=1 Tax=Polyplosphaeria fusca TaxID=682080 RepID=A0A9P4QTN1_9PLEO|nr:hypothetical protein EJ04DRAFT_515031 [Polyplosphaeria fusca]
MSNEVRVAPIESVDDFAQAYHCVSEAFGRQTSDGVWLPLNPNWDTPAGQAEGAGKLAQRWRSVSMNKSGSPNTIFLKASLQDAQNSNKETIVGLAIWQQLSMVSGWGDAPTSDLGSHLGIDAVDERFARQMFASLWKRRIDYAKEKASQHPPAIFVLDMAAVHPNFQRRGIAGKLVLWGLEEAKRRGHLECTTEASVMGRSVYARLGFRPEGEVEFVVDEEFRDRPKPPNVFMRTGREH